MRFNFTYFRKYFTNPIVNIIVADDIHTAINDYNSGPDQFTVPIYTADLTQINDNTWYYNPDPLAAGAGRCFITNENSKFFNINLYLTVQKVVHAKTRRSQMPVMPEYVDLVNDLLFP